MDGNDRDSDINRLRKENELLQQALAQSAEQMRQLEHQAEQDHPPTSKSTFERFKTFIDDNLTTLSEGIRHFPNNIAELKARMQQEREARMAEERLIWYDWTGCADSPDHIQLSIERASHDDREDARLSTCELLRESWRRSKDVPEQKMIDLFRDNEWSFGGLDHFANPRLSFGGACYYKAETVDNLPSTARWGWPTPAPRWLSVDWFMRSPYSPVRLEFDHAPFQSLDTKPVWRAAFEELMCAALDKPMNSHEKVGQRLPYGRPQSTHNGPGLDWMLSLQCRGILPPLLPALYKDDARGRASMSRWRAAMEERHRTGIEVDANLTRDFDALVHEVSIKSMPVTEEAPFRFPKETVNTLARTAYANESMVYPASWQVPETEEDLYAQMFGMQSSQQPQPPSAAEEVELDEDEDEDYDQAAFDIKFALPLDRINEAMMLIESLGEGVKKQMLKDETWRRVVEMSFEERDRLFCELVKLCNPGSDPLDGHPDHEKMPEYMARVGQKTVQKLLGDIERERQSQQSEPLSAEKPVRMHSKMIEAAKKKPNVLSQLTTTQTTRSPDGTVTTTVVLKQRFADGTSQEHESVQTSYEGDDTLAKESTKEKKSGWFWS